MSHRNRRSSISAGRAGISASSAGISAISTGHPPLWTLLVLASACAGFSCASSSDKHAAAGSQYAGMQWDDAKKPAAENPPPTKTTSITANEQLIWRLSMHGFEIGRLALAVGQPGVAEGHRVVIVRAQLESTAAAAIFAPMRQVLTTWVDTSTIQPVYQRREVEAGTHFNWVEVHFAPGAFDVDYRRRALDVDSKDHQTLPPEVPLFDANSLLLAARTWNLQPGERISVNVFREIYVWSIQIERAKEANQVIKTKLGEFPAFRLDGVGRLLNRDGSFDVDDPPRQYSFWISDDDKHLPLVVIAKTDYGDARMELVHHGKSAPQ